jgi:hypothetical protein
MCMMQAALAPVPSVPRATAFTSTPSDTAVHRPRGRRGADRTAVERRLRVAWRRAMRWFNPPVGMARRHVRA